MSEKILAQLRAAGADIPVVVGGNIPVRDHDALRALGVAGVFSTSTDFDEITRGMRAAARWPSN